MVFKMQLPICPLTLELPTDPVIASDGKVYDLSAWNEYKKSMKKKTLVSPVTKQRIKGKVYPAFDIKSIIEDAVKNGHVADNLCSRWKDKIEREARFQQMIKDTQKNPALWDHLGDCYNYGTDTPQCFAAAIVSYTKSYEQLNCAESLRKLSIVMCLRPETTRTDIINAWATICTLTQTCDDNALLAKSRALQMVAFVLLKLPRKLRLHIGSGFPFSMILSECEMKLPSQEKELTKDEKKQVDKWVKEIAHFLMENSKSTRGDDYSESEDEESEESEDGGSQWEEYNAESFD